MGDTDNRTGSVPEFLPALPPAPASATPPALPPALPDPPVIVPPVAAPTFASALGSWLGRLQRRYRHLLFKPRVFFTDMTAPKDRNVIIFLAFGLGLASSIANGDAALLKNAEAVNGHSWPLYWLGRIGHGAFFAAAAFWIGAAWYRFRLRLAGIKAEDIWLVRRIYLSAAMVYAIPIILKALVMSFIHDTPLSAAVADPDWQTRVYAFFPLWSTIVGYIGVRTVYRPRGPGAPVLFLFMPGIFYLLFALVMFGAIGRGVGVLAGPASDVGHPKTYSSETMAFSYPANWSVMKGEKDYDPRANVAVRPVQDARIILGYISVAEGGCGTAVDNVLGSVQGKFGALAPPIALEAWGGFKGAGKRFEGLIRGREYRVWIFVAPVAENVGLYVLEISALADEDKVGPGFELIRSSFRCLRE